MENDLKKYFQITAKTKITVKRKGCFDSKSFRILSSPVFPYLSIYLMLIVITKNEYVLNCYIEEYFENILCKFFSICTLVYYQCSYCRSFILVLVVVK